MAEDLDDGEFWLPSQFLADVEKTDFHLFDTKSGSCFSFPYGFDSSVKPPSALSSPVESTFGSSETESDEEDYLTELTKQIAHSTLQDSMKATPPAFSESKKGWGSPQSTLCGCKQSPSRGSMNGSSQLSPPASPYESKDFNWDLLYAAVGEVARMRKNEEDFGFQNRGLLGQHRKQNLIPPQLLKAHQFQQLKQQQLLKQRQNGVVWGRAQGKANGGLHSQQLMVQNRGGGGGVRPLGFSQSAWPPLQQTQNTGSGSCMRAVFLGAPRRESAGTGVFLPRRVNKTLAEPRKNQTCSTVLLPAKVVQALNLDLDGMGAPPHLNPHFNGAYALDTEAMKFRKSNNYGLSQQRGNHPQARALMNLNHREIGLPQEWTY